MMELGTFFTIRKITTIGTKNNQGVMLNEEDNIDSISSIF